MSPSLEDLSARVDALARGVVAEHAAAVDAEAAFPRAAVDALAEAGLLGLISAREVGGMGHGVTAAARVVERLARECGSTAMVVCMHYAGVAVVERYGAKEVRRGLASGQRLTTLAFSEAGSRSHFWAPTSTAARAGDGVRLDAHKSWVTSARAATDYVWSSTPLEAEGMSTIWLVPADAEGLSTPGPYRGLGLRGNDSSPVTAAEVRVPQAAMLGADGAGFDVMMGTVLPIFSLMNAGCSIGLIEGALSRATAHVSGTRYAHLDSALADLPTIRAYVARMRIRADATRLLWLDACEAAEAGREDAMLRVLEAKAAAGEAALEVLDTAMRVCGGAAYRNDVAVERYFRDGRAGAIMAPTTDQLFDFIGKAVCGLPLF